MSTNEKNAFRKASWLMWIGGGAFLIVRTLARSPVTYLAIAIFIYRYRQTHAAPTAQPLDFNGMVLWYASLDSTMQAAIVTSLITVAGFMLSFYLGTRHWRQQKIADMRLQMSSEIHEFFNSAASNVRSMATMAENLVELNLIIAKEQDDEDALQRARVLAKVIAINAKEFESAKAKLLRAQIEVHDFRSKHSIPLTSSLIGYMGYTTATKILDEIASLAHFSLPLSPEESNPTEQLIRGLDWQMANKFVSVANTKASRMLGGASMGKGAAVGSVLKPNFWSIAISAFSIGQLAKDDESK